MMTVNRAASSFRADLVELIAERAHFGSVVLVARDDLVDRVDDDRVEMLIPDTAHQFRYQLIQRNGVTAQVPNDDVVCIAQRDAERGIYL